MTRSSILSSLVLLVCLAAFAFGTAASAATYYIATNGNDNNPGTDAQPWATFAHAWTVMGPGDTLLVKDGTYYQTMNVAVSGTEASPVTIRALNDGQAIVDGENSREPLRVGTYSAPRHDVVIEGMVFINGNTSVINIGTNSSTPTERVTLRRVSGYNVGTGMSNYHVFNLAWANDILLEDCAASGRGRCMYDWYACNRVTLRRCWGRWMQNNETPYILYQCYNSNDCIVENCVGTMDETKTSSNVVGLEVRTTKSLSDPYDTCDRNKWYGNVVYDVTSYPLIVDSDMYLIEDNEFHDTVCVNTHTEWDCWSFGFQWADINLLVKNATLVGAYDGYVYIVEDQNDPLYDPHVTLKNTILMSGNYGVVADDSDYDSLTNSYNCYWDIAISNWGQQASEGPGEFTANPGFDLTTYGRGGYLFIPDSSSCIGAGDGGEDVGATVLYRYVDGVLTSDPLWPWPMEDRIQNETETYLGDRISVTWETDGTASGGIWKTLDGIYGPQAPTANFSGDPTSGNAPLTVNFADLSTQSPTSWSWTFGDGGTSTAQNPSHDYTSAGDYTVSLTATNAEGNDTETKTDYISVTAPQPPVADFSGNPTSGGAPLTVNFTDLSTNSPTSWSWTFGDGGSSTAQHPSHQYTGAGDYTVSLTATNASGSDDEVKTNYISVTAPQPPVADFSGSPTSGNAPLTVNFTDSSTNSPTSWSWTFGDGGTSNAQNPSHQYTSVGDYTVSLTATNAQGNDTETKTDYISVSESGGEETIFSDDFEAEFSGWYTSGDVTWYSGEPKIGTHSIEMQGNNGWMWHNAPTTGYQDVKLRVYMGAKDYEAGEKFKGYWYDGATYYPVIEIVDGDPEEDGQLHYFDVSLPSGANDNPGFRVAFGQWTADSGDYGYIDNVEVVGTLIGGGNPPVANFSGSPTSGNAPLTVNFTDSSTNSPTSWSWTFGDGGTSTAQNPSHDYTSAGDYTVSLTATNASGNDTETKTDYISVSEAPPPAPVADFSGSPTSGTAPLTVNFTDSSTNSPTSWSWTFGDGGTSTAQNPSHQYTSAGQYTVTLTATNAGGSDDETKTNYITVTVSAPVANFSGSPTSGTAPLTVNFTDSSTNSPTAWSWTFGDGGTSTTQNPSHQYTSAGQYTVTLTATNAGGSDDETKTNYITVTVPAPVANFSGSPTSGNAPLTVNFTDSSTNSPTSWSWSFGDGGTSTAQNPSHEYLGGGDFTVSLEATNAGGSDIETKVDYISVTGPTTIFSDDFETEFSGWTTSGNVAWYTGDPKNGTHAVELKKLGTMNQTISTVGYESIIVSFYMGAKSLDQGTENVQALWSANGTDWTVLAQITDGEEDMQLHYYAFSLPVSADDNANFALQFKINGSGLKDYMYVDDVVVGGTLIAPVADFSGSPTSGTAPLTVNFTDSSTNSPTSWSWTFGDGGTSTAQNPSHQYTSAGQYTVTLTATNAGGSDDETKTDYITVTSGGGAQDYYCDSVSIGIGSIISGDHTSVHSSDNVYLVVHSATANNKQATQQTHVFNTGLSSLSALSVTLEGKVTVASEPVHIYLYNYSTSSWTHIWDDHFGLSDATFSDISVSSPSNYISGGTVQVRIVTGYVHTVAYDLSTDLLKITATP